MHVPLAEDAREAFEKRMGELGPWMHGFHLAPDVYTGYYKYEGLDGNLTWVNSRSPRDDIERMRAAYERRSQTLWPAFLARFFEGIEAADRASLTLLDIGAGTGLNSLLAADLGFGRILSVEIRDNQSAQLRLLLASAANPRYARAVTAVHDPTSADDAEFAGRYDDGRVDIAMSLGLLYHLANPVQHLVNLRRIARRRAIIYTMTHCSPFAKRMWWLEREGAGWITKATSGVSWTPHYLEVARLCREIGFRQVRIVYPEMFARHFRGFERPGRWTDVSLAAAMAADRIAGVKIGPFRNHRFEYFRYSQLNPNYFAYVCDV